MARKLKIRKISTKRSYSTEEIAILLGVHIQTVRTWRKQGLKPIDSTKSPFLFIGIEVKKFLKKRMEINKVSLNQGEIYCLKCRIGVIPIMPLNIERGVIIGGNKISYFKAGICPRCGKETRRFASKPNLDATDIPIIKSLPKQKKSQTTSQIGLFEITDG